MLQPSSRSSATIVDIVSRSRDYQAVVLDGSTRRDQLAAAIIASRRAAPAVVIADATWKNTPNPLEIAVTGWASAHDRQSEDDVLRAVER